MDPCDVSEWHDVDVVCVCTPSGTHCEVAEAAAAAGKHLLVEKPLDVTLERADRIIEAARRHGVKLGGVLPSRFKAGPARAREALAQGRLGRLALAGAYVKWHRPDSYYEGSWRGTLALDGGGALINQSIHTIDLLQWLAGPVKTVFGRRATLAHDIEGEDTACAVLEYANGALGVIEGATSCWPGEPARVELRGSSGSIVLQEGRVSSWKLADSAPHEEEQMLAEDTLRATGSSNPTAISFEYHRRQIVDLLEAIRDDRPPAVDGLEARKSLALVLAIYESAATGKVIELART